MFRARNPQTCWFHTCRDKNMSALEQLIANLNRRWANEARPAMKGCNSSSGKTFLPFPRNGLGEGSLEAHQLRPLDLGALGTNAFLVHPAIPVNYFRRAYEHLLWVTPAQSASTAEGTGIDNRDLPAGRTASQSYRRRC